MSRLKAAQRREQLIEVATKIFAKWGYNAATTAAIAQEAGVTEPILYRHFKNKQEMFVAITREMSKQTLKYWQDLTARVSDPAEQIRTIAREFPDHVRRMSDAYHVIHSALATAVMVPGNKGSGPVRDKKVMAVMREHYEQIERFFIGIVKEGQRAGIFRTDLDPRIPAWQLINTGIGYAMIALNLGQWEHFSIEDTIEFMLRGLKG